MSEFFGCTRRRAARATARGCCRRPRRTPLSAAALPRHWRHTASKRGRSTKNMGIRFSPRWTIGHRGIRNFFSASGWRRFRVSRLCGRGLKATVRRRANDAGEFRLAPEEVAKIDDVQAEQRAWPHRDDGGVARIAGQQRELSKERPGSNTEGAGHHADFALAGGDKIHAVAALAAPDDGGAGRIVARAQKLRDIGEGWRAGV